MFKHLFWFIKHACLYYNSLKIRILVIATEILKPQIIVKIHIIMFGNAWK